MLPSSSETQIKKDKKHVIQQTDKIEAHAQYYRIAGNFVGENFRELRAIRENTCIIRECLVFAEKDRAIALIRENIIHQKLYLVHPRNFSPTIQ